MDIDVDKDGLASSSSCRTVAGHPDGRLRRRQHLMRTRVTTSSPASSGSAWRPSGRLRPGDRRWRPDRPGRGHLRRPRRDRDARGRQGRRSVGRPESPNASTTTQASRTGIGGGELADRFVAQARRYGVELLSAVEVTGSAPRRGRDLRDLRTGQSVGAHRPCCVATGSSYRRLGVPGEDDLIGAGVHFCATCDGPFYRGAEEMLVVGAATRRWRRGCSSPSSPTASACWTRPRCAPRTVAGQGDGTRVHGALTRSRSSVEGEQGREGAEGWRDEASRRGAT